MQVSRTDIAEGARPRLEWGLFPPTPQGHPLMAWLEYVLPLIFLAPLGAAALVVGLSATTVRGRFIASDCHG